MIRNEFFWPAIFLTCYTAFGGIAKDQKQEVPGHRLQIDAETYLTDKNGVASPEQIANVSIGKLVRIYRTDGFCYEGKVNEIEESEGLYKVFGDISNIPGARFGFVLAKGGKFAGAVVEKKDEIIYVLDFSEAHKGFVLKRAYGREKPVL